jgi:cold shock CspA family protein
MERKKETGILMTWFKTRGFGFVHQTVDGEVRTYFVHISQIIGKPEVGASVRFDAGESKKGPVALNVEIVTRTVKAIGGGQ